MKIEALLERLEYRQDSGAADDGVRYWHSHRFGMPVSVVDSIWETAWEAKVNRGTGSRAGLRRLEFGDPPHKVLPEPPAQPVARPFSARIVWHTAGM
jgi:hypothetical protein